jgi:predicted amidophosphoribosyltransferase
VRAQGVLGDVLTWVPGRARDIRDRGFDHAEILARTVASALRLPARRCLTRADARPDQAGLSAQERWRNLEGAFAAARRRGRLIVVDDLVTTGATAAACARALLAAGSGAVEVLAACSAAG